MSDRESGRDDNPAPLLFNTFFATMLMVAFDDSIEAEEVLADIAKKRKFTERLEKNVQLVEAVKSTRGLLSADGASLVSRSNGQSREDDVDHLACGQSVWTGGIRTQDGDHTNASLVR